MWHFAHDYAKAILAFQHASHIDPQLVAPHLFGGIDYYLLSAPRKAIPELKIAARLDARSAIAPKWLGMSFFQTGNFVQAVSELKRALERDPADSEPLFWLCRSYSKILFQSYTRIRAGTPESPFLDRLREPPRQDRDDTIAMDVSEPEPVSTQGWFERGRAAKALGLDALRAYLSRRPESFRVHQLEAEYSVAEGDSDGAIQHYREAIAAAPNAVQLHLAIANIYMTRHDYEGAVPELQAELALDPYSLNALERIGQAYAELKDTEHAQSFLKRALALDPQSFEARRALGKVCYDRGNYAEAVANFRVAVEAADDHPAAILFQLSTAYRKAGNQDEADRWLRRFRQELAREHEKAELTVGNPARN